MGATSFVMSRLVARFGALRVLNGALIAFASLSTALLIVSIAGDGRPPFWLWFGVLTLTNSSSIAINPTSNSLAMEPMGAQAGTASGVLGAAAIGGGALMAAPFSAAIVDSVTPLAVGYVIYTAVAVALVRAAQVTPAKAAPRDASAPAE